jgi:iron complex outermembrane receptor protein
LSLDLTAGYTHSDIGGVSAADAAATGVRNGNRLPQTPESTFSASAEYRFDLNVGTLAPRLSYAWQDRQYFDAANNPETVEASYGLLDAQMALESVNKRWRWVAYGNDLTNKVYFNSLFRSGGGQAVAYPAPARQYGFKVRYSF